VNEIPHCGALGSGYCVRPPKPYAYKDLDTARGAQGEHERNVGSLSESVVASVARLPVFSGGLVNGTVRDMMREV